MQNLGQIAKRVSVCRKCRLWETRKNTVPGEGPSNSKLFLIGEGPGESEDETGRPFIGQSGRLLSKMMEEAGIDRKKVFITSILKCRPPRNRKPKEDEIKSCMPYLQEQIEAVQPKMIGLMGLVAIKNTIGDHRKLKEMHGKVVKQGNYNYFITYHPAAARRFKKFKQLMAQDFKKLKRLTR